MVDIYMADGPLATRRVLKSDLRKRVRKLLPSKS